MEAGERLRRLREAKGLSAAQLAQRVGRSESAVRNQENGTNGIPSPLAAQYAKALGTTAAHILYGEESVSQPSRLTPEYLPVRYRVQAGLWYEVDDFVDELPTPEQAVAPNARFAAWRQWIELVAGDSMNQFIADGCYAHVVDAIDMGYSPRTGDLVVVERRRMGGSLRERTIKQVEVLPGAVRLWPRSTNPRWNEPLAYSGEQADDGIEVEIVGYVIGAYNSFA